MAAGMYGRGVSGEATGEYGLGVYGAATGTYAYAGFFDGRGYFAGNVGIGTNVPSVKLEVVGDVGVGGNIHVAGNVHVAGNLTWQTRTGYLSIPAADFTPQEDGYNFYNDGYKLRSGGLNDNYFAGVHLPHGAWVTRMTFYWNDPAITANGSSELRRSTLDGWSREMAHVFTSGSGGKGNSYDDSIGYAIIDNSQYAYYLQWVLPDSSSGTVLGYGVVIEYTYTGPH